ncbi:hypothetical protein KCP74_03475 [Salmonella enterica subsp. enterica]|nr:hypothetical protein KCP74_03475 [Salmonella enterica subsp. enterica]
MHRIFRHHTTVSIYASKRKRNRDNINTQDKAIYQRIRHRFPLKAADWLTERYPRPLRIAVDCIG